MLNAGLRWKLARWLPAAILLLASTSVRAQNVPITPPLPGYTTVVPLHGVTHDAVRALVGASTTIPMFDYSVKSPIDGNTYTGSMVGRSPFFNGSRTTSVQAFIIPLIIKMPDGGVFDPTVPDTTCLGASNNVPLTLTEQSPLFNDASFNMGPTFVGNTQYIDAFQRGNFWGPSGGANVSTTGNSYHTLLNPVTPLSAVTVNIPSGEGTTYPTGATFGFGCGNLGVMDNGTFDSIIQSSVIPSLAAQGVGPTNFPIFLLYNVVQGAPGDSPFSNCCILGYHGAFGSVASVQTYSPMDFDSTGIFSGVANTSVMGHETGEWMDDPLGTNPTPSWGHIGQVTGCQNNLEVGDPLSGTLFPAVTMSNGFTYDLQELAFFSWFYRQSPSIGVNGFYSDNDTFTTGAGAVCF